jgi:hypothetical protein
MPFSAATAWLARHRPAGLCLLATAEGSRYGVPLSEGYAYAGPANPAWATAYLDVSWAPAGPGNSVLRVDGLVVWLDPVPVRDTAAGKRLRVVVAAGCPRTDVGVVGVANPGRTDLAHALVPAGQPWAGLTCRYADMIGGPFGLGSQRRLTGAQARRLAAEMARKSLSHPIGVVYHCPMDQGSAELIALSYRGRPDVDLWVHLDGCGECRTVT